MDTIKVNNENKRRKKANDRRSSILKVDRPTLADLDINKKAETKISRRSSKRVSFAETYQVKEFPKDSPQRWLRDLHNADSEDDDDKSSGSKKTAGSEILGLDQLLTGQIQNPSLKQDAEMFNKTIMDGADMEETVCVDASIHQNTTLSNTISEEEDKKVDTISFLNNLMKKSKSDSEAFLQFPDESDEEDYKASSFFKGGSNGFFSTESTKDADGKIDNKSFLAKLQSINSSSKQFSQERVKREIHENQTVVFDGLDADMEMTTNFTATLQNFKKRQSTGNVLESTRIFAEDDDAMEMTRNVTSNLEVIRSNLPISDFESSKTAANKSVHSKLGTSTMLGVSANRGFDQTRVFSNYEDPTSNMDLTAARGGILNNTKIGGEEPEPNPSEAESQVKVQAESRSCPEVTVHFGQQEIDADMEMTEALDPTLVITNDKTGTTNVKVTKDNPSKPKRALADVTAHFEGEGHLMKGDEEVVPGRKRNNSISPVDMGKENVSVHIRQIDTQADMDFTSYLTTKVESLDKENIVVQEQIRFSSHEEKTQVFSGSESVADMEFTTCIETCKTITTQVDDTISFKTKAKLPEMPDVEKEKTPVDDDNVTRVFGSRDVTAAMDLTECHELPLKKPSIQEVKSTGKSLVDQEDKTRVFTTGDVTAAMDLTECISAKTKINSTVADQTVHFEKQAGSMDLTACQTGLVCMPSSNDDKIRVFNAEDATAAMEMTECQQNVVASEQGEIPKDKTTLKSETEADEDVAVKSRKSLPARVEEPSQSQVAEIKSVPQRRSLYSGMNAFATNEGFSAQSLKRKLYSFDMMMAGAKARTVKVAKRTDSDIAKRNEDYENDKEEKPVVETESANEKTSGDPCLQSDKIDLKSECESPDGAIPLETADHTHTSTEILKLGTSEQEVSALEVLKNLALEEDTLDDTKLLELRMLAKKNSSEKLKPVPESPSDSPLKDNNSDSEKSDELETSQDKDKSPPEDDDDGVTQYNTTTALAMLLAKMNCTTKTKTAKQSSDKSSVQLSPGARSATKHSSVEPITAGNKKKAKLDAKDAPDTDDITLNSIEQPVQMVDNDTVTSLGSAGSESSVNHTLGQQSQSGASLSQSLLFFLDKKQDKTDDLWDFEIFCERMGISQFQPKHHRLSSINIQPALETETLQNILQLQAITQTETQVKEEVYQELRQQLDRDEEEIEKQKSQILEREPPLFNKLRNSEISQDDVHSSYKACQRWAKAQLKRERVIVSKQCLERLKIEKDRLCSGLDEVVTQAERVLTDLASVDSMITDIDKQLEEIQLQPAQNETEVVVLQDDLHQKSEELKKLEEAKAEILRQVSERKERERTLESECQRQELQMLKERDISEQTQLVEELQQRLMALERVLEWKAKDLSPSRDVFLILYGAIELSITYDIIQHKTLDCVTVSSHLAEASSPWSHLASRLVLAAVDGVKLRSRFPSRDQLPQLLHEVSNIVSHARNLACEVSKVDLYHRVVIKDHSLSVALLNTRKIQKLNLTFQFEPGTSSSPAECLIDVVIGSIQKEKVQDIVDKSLKGPHCLFDCISRVQQLLDS